MKVYLLYFDNGCEYSDHNEWIVGVFSTLEKAEAAKEFTRPTMLSHKRGFFEIVEKTLDEVS